MSFMQTRTLVKIINNSITYSKRLYCSRNFLKLHERGIFQEVFPPANPELQKLLQSRQCVYGGFDPTAESLHIGNLLVIIGLLHCQRAGHEVIALVGGATGLIGDPTGRTTERPALGFQVAKSNTEKIAENLQRIFANHEKHFWQKLGHKDQLVPLKVVNNAEWYGKMSMVEFLSSVGKHFRVGMMLGRHSVQSRLNSESGLSYTEFSYQALQAYDWLHLLREYKCRFQIGGHDQLGNIMSGHELISRATNEEVFGMTIPLITSESGDKLGKSAGNAVWITASKTSPFELYQFFMRVKDSEVEKLLKLFTFLSLEEIQNIMAKQNAKPESRHAQRKLAENVTLLVHGESGLSAAERTTAALYDSSIDSLASLSSQELMDAFQSASVSDLLLKPAFTVLELAMKAGCFRNEADARRIITAGGLYINHQRCTNIEEYLAPGRHILPNGVTLIRVGKKNYYIVKWSF